MNKKNVLPTSPHDTVTSAPPLVFSDASIEPLWRNLNLTVQPGEFLAVLGSNGVGKSTLLNSVLGTQTLSSGTVSTTDRIGYIPQQRMFDPDLPIRARDLVGLSLASGVVRRRRPRRKQVDAALRRVGAESLANARVGALSGGQQQLIRQAQALAKKPQLLLCDEPLLSLDLRAQKDTVTRLDEYRRETGAAVVFVTHSINPILEVTDRVLYITPHGHRQGTVEEIINSATLSELYQTEITVAEINGKLVIVA